MNCYEVLKTTLYESIVLSLLRRNILSLDEAVGCLNDINSKTKIINNLHKEIIMVKQKGLTNTSIDKSDLEAINND